MTKYKKSFEKYVSNSKTQDAYKSRVRLWKINHPGPGCINQINPVLTHFLVTEWTWWLEQLSRWRQAFSGVRYGFRTRRTLQRLLLINRDTFQNKRKDSKMYHPSRGGVRGGQDQFDWEDVKADKYRENYLGESHASVFQFPHNRIWALKFKNNRPLNKHL